MDAMRQALRALLALAVLAPSPAAAQASDATGLGLGVQSMLTEFGFATAGTLISGPSVVYTTPAYHAEGILSYESNGQTNLGLAGRFFYEIHSARSADLSLGGGLGFVNIDIDGADDSQTDIHLELGAKLRGFVTPNVAINVSLGLAIIMADSDQFDVLALTGQLAGGAGLTYFFF